MASEGTAIDDQPARVVSAPPSSMPRSPLIPSSPAGTPKRLTPLPSPVRKVVDGVKAYFDPHDAWLPITESQNGNAYYAGFHTLCSGVGFQALLLPISFTILGWEWGVLALSAAFVWQFYTLWLLLRLHESEPGTGPRFSRYAQIAEHAFGPRLGKLLAWLPIVYLSAAICSALIIMGGSSMHQFYDLVCGGASCHSRPLTPIEWCLVFACIAGILSQLPNLNSIAGVSLVGAVTAVAYITLIWVVSITKGRVAGVSYHPVEFTSSVDGVLGVLNALGLIAFAFRGHNLVLEIQGTMPSTTKKPSFVPMWRGVKCAYLLVAFCLFPIAIAGFWSYGIMIPGNGILSALNEFHARDTSRGLLGLITMLVVVNTLSSYQICAMPMLDNMEAGYTRRKNKRCPWWVRSGFRVAFTAVAFLVAVAFPFLSNLAGLLGGVSLPVTLAYPCFMWVAIKKPRRGSGMWFLNWGLGSLGMGISLVLVIGGVWSLVNTGLKLQFFNPQ